MLCVFTRAKKFFVRRETARTLTSVAPRSVYR
jgi:hypothetical protein